MTEIPYLNEQVGVLARLSGLPADKIVGVLKGEHTDLSAEQAAQLLDASATLLENLAAYSRNEAKRLRGCSYLELQEIPAQAVVDHLTIERYINEVPRNG